MCLTFWRSCKSNIRDDTELTFKLEENLSAAPNWMKVLCFDSPMSCWLGPQMGQKSKPFGYILFIYSCKCSELKHRNRRAGWDFLRI